MRQSDRHVLPSSPQTNRAGDFPSGHGSRSLRATPLFFVNSARPHSTLLWAAVGIAAVIVGVPLGQQLRSVFSAAPSGESEKIRTPRELTSGAAQSNIPANPTDHSTEDTLSDDAIEAELSRLLGASSRAGGSRSTIEVMDAISAANQEKSDLRRYLLIYEAVSELGRSDFEAALIRARKENNSIAQRAIERRWAEVDPLSAAKAWADGSEKLVGDSFFSSWVKINPSSALTWFSGLEEGPQRQKARELILERVAKYDPQRALDFSNQITNEKDRNALVARSLKTVAESDLPQAITLARSLPEGTTRDTALDTVITQIASTDLASAQKLIAENPNGTFSRASASVAAGLLKQSPVQAVAWADSLPEGSAKEAAYAGIAREWSTRDMEAVAEWLDKLPASAARDAAVVSFAGRNAARDPEGATLWAATLPNSDSKKGLLMMTVRNWQRTNPEAAQKWIDTAEGLSAAEKESLSTLQSASKPGKGNSKTPDKPKKIN